MQKEKENKSFPSFFLITLYLSKTEFIPKS